MPIAPRARRRDVLSDGTDVTTKTERELLLFVIDEVFVVQSDVGKLAGEVGDARREIADIKVRLQPNGEIEHRARAVSSHAFEGIAQDVAQRIVEAVHDDRDGGRGNITIDRVLDEIRKYDAGKAEKVADDRKKFKRDLTVAIIAALVGVAAAGALGHVEGRATAPAAQAHP